MVTNKLISVARCLDILCAIYLVYHFYDIHSYLSIISKKKKGEKGHVQMVIYHMVINVLNVTLNLKFSLGYSYNYCVTLINIHKKNI